MSPRLPVSAEDLFVSLACLHYLIRFSQDHEYFLAPAAHFVLKIDRDFCLYRGLHFHVLFKLAQDIQANLFELCRI